MAEPFTAFAPWLERWALTAEGEPFQTPYTKSLLMPVRRAGEPAMLKIATEPEELRGAVLMAWYGGDGAARVLAHEGEALLLERLEGTRSLAAMARAGQDDEASRILCAAAARLHAPRPVSPSALVPLDVWFRALAPAAAAHGGAFATGLVQANALLGEPRDPCALHADLHHMNVIDGCERGWLAIDPKGVWGERTYEFAPMLCNPDAETALAPGRLSRQVQVIAEVARLEPRRLLRWLVAHAAVASAWCLQDGFDAYAAQGLAIAELAASEL
jgi:streptomycin 6-kinase